MSCIKNFFRCNFEDKNNESFAERFCEKQIASLRAKVIDLELELKSLKVAHDLEIKRIEDKLTQQISILTTKIDNLAILVASKNS